MSDYIERDKIMNFCNAVINRQGNEEEMNVVVESFKAFAEYVKALPYVQQEEAIPISWIESRIERFMMAGDAFSGLTASIIRVMLNEWEKEQEGGTDDK